MIESSKKVARQGDNEPAGLILWLPLGVAALCSVAVFNVRGLSVGANAFAALPEAFCVVAAALYLQSRGRASKLTGLLLYNNYLGLLALTGIVGAYAAGTLHLPLADPWLIAADRALGYDWRGYAGFYVSHPTIAAVILPGYTLAYILPTLTILVFVLTDRTRAVEQYILAMLLATVATIALFCLLPARTAWGATGVPLNEVRALKYLPLPDQGWEADLIRLRMGC